MFTTAANFIIALIEQRPVAAGNILRDAGGARALDLDMQGLQKRLEEALERKKLEAQFELANGILSDSLRIEANVAKDCDFTPLTGLLVHGDSADASIHQAAIKIAEEAFELGRRAVEKTVELHAADFAQRLEATAKPKFMEVNIF
jgi:hypothetical protein